MKSPSLEFIIRDAHPKDAPCLARYNQQLAKETEGKELDASILLAGVYRRSPTPAPLPLFCCSFKRANHRAGHDYI